MSQSKVCTNEFPKLKCVPKLKKLTNQSEYGWKIK